mmetsp:Transcript_27002/g.88875  ORF Transcript_27002/g.88875 Transcript_27002/m.88875 type:complete len:247 (-) Transcript_27002:119-859(-)
MRKALCSTVCVRVLLLFLAPSPPARLCCHVGAPSPRPRRPRQLAVEQGGGLVGGHVEDGEVAWEGGEDGLVLGPVSVEANVPSEAAVPDPHRAAPPRVVAQVRGEREQPQRRLEVHRLGVELGGQSRPLARHPLAQVGRLEEARHQLRLSPRGWHPARLELRPQLRHLELGHVWQRRLLGGGSRAAAELHVRPKGAPAQRHLEAGLRVAPELAAGLYQLPASLAGAAAERARVRAGRVGRAADKRD